MRVCVYVCVRARFSESVYVLVRQSVRVNMCVCVRVLVGSSTNTRQHVCVRERLTDKSNCVNVVLSLNCNISVIASSKDNHRILIVCHTPAPA